MKLDRKQDLNVLKFVFFQLMGKQDGRPGLWLAETFSTSSLKQLNGIQRNLIGSKMSTSSTKFVFFEPIGKTRWLPWPLIGWDIFDFFSETAERNSTKLYRKQDFNVLCKVCVFRADLINKMAALASDWLRHFWLLLWNRWTDFNETLQEARSQRPLPSLCFSGRSEKTRWLPWPLSGLEIFDFSETAERNSTELDRKQDLNVLKFVFFQLMGKQDGRPGLWFAETFSTSLLKPLNRIQRTSTESKIFYQVCVFRVNQCTKMAFLGVLSKRWHIVLRCTICGPLGLLGFFLHLRAPPHFKSMRKLSLL